MELSYVILLGFAVSIDGFFAGVAYGIKGIRLPSGALAAIGAVTLLYTGIAVGSAQYLATALPLGLTASCSALLLVGLGAAALIRQVFSSDAPAPVQTPQNLTFSLGKVVVLIMKKPEYADMDHSQRLSIAEALLLGTALGIDNMAATFAAGLANGLPPYTPPVMCVIQTALLYGGLALAKKIVAPRLKRRLAYTPGLVLIALGLLRFF